MTPAKKAPAKKAPAHPDGTHESRAKPMPAPDPLGEAEARHAEHLEAEREEAEGAAQAAVDAAAEAPTDAEIDQRLSVSQVDGEFNPMVVDPKVHELQPDELADYKAGKEDEALKAWASSRRSELDAEFDAEGEGGGADVGFRSAATDGVGLAVPTPPVEGTAAVFSPVSGLVRGLSPCAMVLYVVDGRDIGLLGNVGRGAITPGDVVPAMVVSVDGPGRGTIRVFGPTPEADFGVAGVALIETPDPVEAGHMGRCFWPPRV